MAESSFGLTVRAEPLGSQQDSNFLLVEPVGAVAGVLKIANPAFTAAEIEAQDLAARCVAALSGGLRAGTVLHGPVTVPVDGALALARVLRHLPGGTLASAGCYLSPRVVAGLGTVAGQVSRALGPFTPTPGSTGCCSGTCGTRFGWSPRWPGTCGTRACGRG